MWSRHPKQLYLAEREVRLAKRVRLLLKAQGFTVRLTDYRQGWRGERLYPAQLEVESECGLIPVLVRTAGFKLEWWHHVDKAFIDENPGAIIQVGAKDITALLAHLRL